MCPSNVFIKEAKDEQTNSRNWNKVRFQSNKYILVMLQRQSRIPSMFKKDVYCHRKNLVSDENMFILCYTFVNIDSSYEELIDIV